MTPTRRTLALMRSQGYDCDVVERRQVMHGRKRQAAGPATISRDLWGFGDVLCLHRSRPHDIVVVQTTSLANLSARITKIEESERVAAVRRAGIRILAHGWRKLVSGWAVKEVDCS